MLVPPVRLRGPVTRADGGKSGVGRGYGGARIDLELLTVADPRSRQLVAAQIIWTLARADIKGPYVIRADGASLDTRCYRVNFDKALERLKYYRPRWTAQKGVEECYAAFQKHGVTLEEFEGPRYQRLAHIQMLLSQGVINKDLRFVQPTPALAA